MSVCTKCDGDIDDDELLSSSEVYGEMASGNDRDDLLASYTGIMYGPDTVLCAECLDTPSECPKCGGAGTIQTVGDRTDTESCPECDGTGTTKPNLLRIASK